MYQFSSILLLNMCQQVRLLAIEKVTIKTELKRLDAMPACPESSRKSPKII